MMKSFAFVLILSLMICYNGAQPFKFGHCTNAQLKQIELKQLRCLQGIGFDEARLTKQAQTAPFEAADSLCSFISKLKQCNYIVDGLTCLNQNEKEQYYAIADTFVEVAEGLCANKMKNIWGLAIHGSKCWTENFMDFTKCVPGNKLEVEVFLRDVNNGFCKMTTCLDSAASTCTAEAKSEIKNVIDDIKDANSCRPGASNNLFINKIDE